MVSDFPGIEDKVMLPVPMSNHVLEDHTSNFRWELAEALKAGWTCDLAHVHGQ